MKRLKSIILLLIFCQICHAQKQVNLTFFLEQVESGSLNFRLAKAGLNIALKEVANFKAENRPNISANIQLLDFHNTTRAITQPTGAIDFLNISQNTSDFFLEGTYNSLLTGGTLFVQSNLQRFDDFSFDIEQYNSVPFRIGIIQPIFGHNLLKWKKRKNDLNLKYTELNLHVQKKFLESRVVGYFFETIYTKEAYQNNIKRLRNAEFLYAQYAERMKLGTGDIEDYLLLELELENTKLDQERSNSEYQIAEDNLWNFVGLAKPSEEIKYLYPEVNNLNRIDPAQALELFYENSPARQLFEVEMLEIERKIDLEKKNNGINGNILASYGYTKASDALNDLLRSPLSENQISVQFTVPIYDWGRRSNAVDLLKIRKEEQKLISEVQDLENLILLNTALKTFQLTSENISYLKNIERISSIRYQKINEKHSNGDVHTLELVQAIRDLDQINLKLIDNKRNYWSALFNVDYQTGHDYSDVFYPSLR